MFFEKGNHRQVQKIGTKQVPFNTTVFSPCYYNYTSKFVVAIRLWLHFYLHKLFAQHYKT